ncbi:hypothetical protein [Desulfogranum mediterraneum]|nr:hypothetical protein [Desulfogranum mediterraneum]
MILGDLSGKGLSFLEGKVLGPFSNGAELKGYHINPGGDGGSTPGESGK